MPSNAQDHICNGTIIQLKVVMVKQIRRDESHGRFRCPQRQYKYVLFCTTVDTKDRGPNAFHRSSILAASAFQLTV